MKIEDWYIYSIIKWQYLIELKEELFQPHDIEISKTEIPEVLDVNKKSMEELLFALKQESIF